jgi:hypothetical protein
MNSLSKSGFTKSQQILVKGLIDYTIAPYDFQDTRNCKQNAYNEHENWYIIMVAINEVLDGYGVHYCEEYDFEYVNIGDTYDCTVVYDRELKEFKITSWGDYIEIKRRK